MKSFESCFISYSRLIMAAHCDNIKVTKQFAEGNDCGAVERPAEADFEQTGKRSDEFEVLNKLITNKSSIGFICDAGGITGYVSLQSLMNAIQTHEDFERTVDSKTDILKVPESAPVEFYYNCSVFLGLNEQEEIIGYTTADEAEVLLKEKQLTEMNESMDHAQIGIITTDEKFRITFMNETAETIMGLPRTFLMERNYRALIHTDRDLGEVLEGKRLLNVKSSFNFKRMSGHFSPIYKKDIIKGMVHVFSFRNSWKRSHVSSPLLKN